MSSFFKSLKSTIIAGIVFLIPLFVIIVIMQKVYKGLTGFGAQLSSLLGIKTVAGVGAASIGTTIILLLLFYVCGLLVRFAVFTSMRDWIENNLLQHIPGYLNYKVKMEEKLMPKAEARIAAFVKQGDISRPGFLVHRSNGKCVVFIPNTPDTNTGEVWIVDGHQVQELGTADGAFLDGIRHSGKGIELM